MQNSLKIEVNLFGAFRAYSDGSPLRLDVPNGTTLEELKSRIRSAMPDQSALIDESALADEQEVLRPGYQCTRNASLALLPPVCGG